MADAYRYIRYSTPEQAQGDSFRRQSEMADAWAAKNGFVIVETISDLGVSAFRGKNLRQGNLADFVARADSGKIATGSVLLVESLDRFSRDVVTQVLPDFLKLINSEIGIVTLGDGKLYTKDSLNEDVGQLLTSLLQMMRGNQESSLKSDRVGEAWAKKRDLARAFPEDAAAKLTDRVPAWLKSDRITIKEADGERTKRQFVPIPEHVAVVRRIFKEAIQGYGRRAIAKRLNGDADPEVRKAFRSGKCWQPSSVAKILSSRAVLGEYHPHKRDENGIRVPEEKAIKNYYPAIVDEATFDKAQAAVKARKSAGAGRPSSDAESPANSGQVNLIRGIARCACGARMEFINKGRPPKGGRYFVCSAAVRDAETCDRKRLWRCETVESALLHQIGPGALQEVFEPEAKPAEPTVQEYDKLIAEAKVSRKRAMELFVRNVVKSQDAQLEEVIKALDTELEDLERKRDAIAARKRHSLRDTRAALQSVSDFAKRLDSAAPEERAHLRQMIAQQLRIAFAEIRFWKDSFEGLIELPSKPQRPKPDGRPRGPWSPRMKPHETRMVDGTERYFALHPIYTEDPDYLAFISDGQAKPGDGLVYPAARRA